MRAMELGVSLSIIGACAAIFLSAFLRRADDLRLVMLKSRLAEIRAAIVIYRAGEIAKGRDAYPPLDLVQDNAENKGSLIMADGDLPDNPLSTGADKDGVVMTQGRPKQRSTAGAWAYDPQTGHFYADTLSGKEDNDH